MIKGSYFVLIGILAVILASCALGSRYAFHNPEPELTYKRTYWANDPATGKWEEYPTYWVKGQEYINSKLERRQDSDGWFRTYTKDDRPVFYIMEMTHSDPEAINWLCHYRYRVKVDEPVLGCAMPADEEMLDRHGERTKGVILYPAGEEYEQVIAHERLHILEKMSDMPARGQIDIPTNRLGPRPEQRMP